MAEHSWDAAGISLGTSSDQRQPILVASVTVVSDFGPSLFSIDVADHSILTPSGNAVLMNRNVNPLSSNIAAMRRNSGPALPIPVAMDCNIASILQNIALVSHTSTPETSTRGPRFICTAAALRGRRVLIGDGFAA